MRFRRYIQNINHWPLLACKKNIDALSMAFVLNQYIID